MEKKHAKFDNCRLYERYAVNLPTKIMMDGQMLYATIKDISVGGSKLHFALDPRILDVNKLDYVIVPGVGQIDAQVTWMSHKDLGVKFNHSSITSGLIRRFVNESDFDEAGSMFNR